MSNERYKKALHDIVAIAMAPRPPGPWAPYAAARDIAQAALAYRCSECGNTEGLKTCINVWVPVEAWDDEAGRETWEPDWECASGFKDSAKGFCPKCDNNVLIDGSCHG